MANSQPLNENDRENLTAYLDGELDAKTARTMEARLSQDVAARKEAETLRRTWEMLDLLPRPAPSPTFASKTLQTISALRPAPKVRLTRPWPFWAFAASWAAALLISGLAGFVGESWIIKRPPSEDLVPVQAVDRDQLLLRDLRLLENRALYDAVDDINFVRELDTPELFGESH
jgi:anti-sigma factor RsiW